jgi:hypothetical protein
MAALTEGLQKPCSLLPQGMNSNRVFNRREKEANAFAQEFRTRRDTQMNTKRIGR